MDKDVQVRKKEDAKYKKRTACLLLCLSYGCECPGWVRDPDFLKENDNKKIGIIGASTTGTLALTSASYFSDISLIQRFPFWSSYCRR